MSTKYATIGDDGMRPVVWGLGDDIDAAHEDALSNLREAGAQSTEPLRTVPVSAGRAALIEAGDVSAEGL